MTDSVILINNQHEENTKKNQQTFLSMYPRGTGIYGKSCISNG